MNKKKFKFYFKVERENRKGKKVVVKELLKNFPTAWKPEYPGENHASKYCDENFQYLQIEETKYLMNIIKKDDLLPYLDLLKSWELKSPQK